MTNLMVAHNQWQNRPGEERFWDIPEMMAACLKYKTQAIETDPFRLGSVRPVYLNNQICLDSGKNQALLTNYSFGQLSLLTQAPAGYLRNLPPELAVQCLQHGITANKDKEVVGLMRREEGLECRCLTSDKYTRIWNYDIVEKLSRFVSRGWRTPPARPHNCPQDRIRVATAHDVMSGSRIQIGEKIGPAGLYASDRDMFMLFINPDRAIEDGETILYRGFIVENSEVGDRAFKITMFLFNSICGNHIIWDAKGVTEIKVVHRGTADERAFNGLSIELKQYADSSTADEKQKIAAAKKFMIPGKTPSEVIDFLFTKKLATKEQLTDAVEAVKVFPEDRGGAAPFSAWSIAQGVTRVSQKADYTADRMNLDRAAGKILKMAF